MIQIRLLLLIKSTKTILLTEIAGCPSRIHDARIFDLSFISKKIVVICDNQFHILGDAAYPINDFLITPFRDNGHLTQQETSFNRKHSATRVRIENAFGLLKHRFRSLVMLEFHKIDKTSLFILACCVLHNRSIRANDTAEFYDAESDDDENNDPMERIEVRVDCENRNRRLSKAAGERKRNDLCRRMNRN